MIKNLLFFLFLFLELAFANGFRESLTNKEIEWLEAHPVIKHTGNPVYLPYEAFDAKGRHLGMVDDYLDIIEGMLGVKIERVASSSWEDALEKSRQKKVDILTNYTNDDDFASSHIITKGFIRSPIVIVKQKHDYYQPFISDFSELKNEKIALGRRYAFLRPVFKEYPELNYIEIDTIENVLKGVSSGEFDAAIVSLNIGTYNIFKHGLRNLQIVGRYDFDLELGFQVAKEDEVLLHILNKALDALSQEQHQKILNKWTAVEIKKELDYRYTAVLLFIIAVGTLLYFFRSYELKKEIAKSTSDLSKLLKVFDEHVIASETDLEGNITYASKAFCNINGYTKEELIGKNHRIIKHPDNDPKIYKELWETITAGKTWRGLVKNRKKNGGYYWADTVIMQDYDAWGKPFGYMAVRHDVTAKVELQEFSANLEQIVKSRTEELLALNKQQKAIFDSADIGIMLLQDRVIKQLNNRVCEISGYDESELLGATTRIFCESDESYEKIADYYKVLETGGMASWEQNILKKDGSSFIAKIRLKIKDDNNPSAGAVAIIDDVTLEHKALEDIKKAKEMAEDATRAKSQFLANVSHEIRTPMSAVIGMSHLALETDLNEKQRGYVKKIDNAAKNLLAVINDILDFSKIEAKKMTLEHKVFYLEDLFENLINLFVFKMKEKKLQMLFSIEYDVPSAFLGDSLKLSQILTNLVSNAIKFTSSGEIIIGVKVKEMKNRSVALEFWVQDSGIGLSQEQIKNLFTPFHQADGSITRIYGGTGLGLSISKHLVEMMGGSIGVESEFGKGSRFYFDVEMDLAQGSKTLLKADTSKKLFSPSNLHDAVLHAFGKKMPIYNGYNEVAKSLRGAKILLVEDNEENQQIVKELLDRVGVEVSVANNGEEALKKVDDTLFDVILMDCQMPIMDGYKATRVLRQDKHMMTMPIIAMTANVMQSDKDECAKAGMSDFVAKPIDVKLFYATLVKWIKPKKDNQFSEEDAADNKEMKLYKLDIYGVDIDKALKRVADDENILYGMLKRFANSQKETMPMIIKSLQQKRVPDMKREVHTLKGLCENIEVTAIYKELQNIENMLNEDDVDYGSIELKIRNIEKELDKTISSIEENLKKFKEESEPIKRDVMTQKEKEELATEFSMLHIFFESFDSDAIGASEILAEKLLAYMSKSKINPMLKASLNFDFEEADKELKQIAKELDINLV
ncbi:MAG: PAS domain S-box protein [Sulfurimonas sp.]|nr:PAS domain S-box protein [Sulfurimonas sp.]